MLRGLFFVEEATLYSELLLLILVKKFSFLTYFGVISIIFLLQRHIFFIAVKCRCRLTIKHNQYESLLSEYKPLRLLNYVVKYLQTAWHLQSLYVFSTPGRMASCDRDGSTHQTWLRLLHEALRWWICSYGSGDSGEPWSLEYPYPGRLVWRVFPAGSPATREQTGVSLDAQTCQLAEYGWTWTVRVIRPMLRSPYPRDHDRSARDCFWGTRPSFEKSNGWLGIYSSTRSY